MGFATNTAIIVILASLFMFTTTYMLLDSSTYYSIDIEPEYQNISNEFAAQKQIYENQQELIDSGTIDADAQDVAIFKNTIPATKQLTTSAKLTQKMLSQAQQILNIHPFIVGSISLIVFLLMTVTIIGLFLRDKP